MLPPPEQEIAVLLRTMVVVVVGVAAILLLELVQWSASCSFATVVHSEHDILATGAGELETKGIVMHRALLAAVFAFGMAGNSPLAVAQQSMASEGSLIQTAAKKKKRPRSVRPLCSTFFCVSCCTHPVTGNETCRFICE